jgi:uncharacterized membrane protein YdjX (TVP38/TMEM64 family)
LVKRVPWIKLVAAAIVIAAHGAAWRLTRLSEYLTPAHINEMARTLRETSWAPFALVLAYTPAEFLMFPRPVLTLFGSIAFGAWLGAAYGLAGIFIASLATYFAGNMLPEGTVRRMAGERVERVAKMLRRHGVLAVLAVRVVPVAPSGVEGVVAGAMRIKLWEYLVGTMLGMTPGVLATAFFGGQVATALDDPSKVNYWLIGAVVLVLGTMTFFVGRRLAKAAAPR